MVSWKHQTVKVETIYTVEYIDNAKDFERFSRQGVDEWEAVKKKRFVGDVGEAMAFYFARMYDPVTLYLNLFEEIFVDGESVREATIEPEATFRWNMRRWIERETAERLDAAERKIQDMEKDREIFDKFMQGHKEIYNGYRDYYRREMGS